MPLWLIVFFLILFNYSVYADQNKNCNWENKSSTPCITIAKDINNTSRFTSHSVKKKIITKDQIDKIGAIDIIDVINSLPSINITQSGPKGQQASMFMRGTSSNHVLVMINGIAINDQSTTQGLYDFGVDFIQTIQQIEVYEGPGSANFGPNAIGGAVNIITTGDLKDFTKFSSRDKKNYNFIFNKNFISDNSNLYNFKFGAVERKTKSARFSGNEIDGMKNLTGNFNFEKWIDNFHFTNSTYLRETIAEYDGSASNENNFVGNNKMLTTQFNLSQLKENSKNELIFYHNLYDREYNEQGTNDYYESNATGIKYNFTKSFDEISYGYGSEYRYDSGEFVNNGTYSASTKGNYDNLSVYGNLGYNLFDNILFSLILRSDENKQTGSNQSNKINIEHKFDSFNIGIGRNEGFRNPTIYELYGTDNFGYAGNRKLKEEKSISNEIYLEIKPHNDISGSIRGFSSKINDQIEYKSNKYVNSSKGLSLKQSGINSEIIIKGDNYNLNLFSSFLSSDKVDGSPQLRRPEKTYGLNLQKNFDHYLLGKFNMNLKYNHYGKHFDTHSSSFATIEMDSTDILDLSFNKNFRNYLISFNTTNLLNEKYQRPHGYSQDERLFYLAMKIGF